MAASKFRGDQVAFNPTYFGITATSDTAGRWTANIEDIKEYYDGLKITLLLSTSYNATYNTININGLGQKLIWFRKDSRLTSHVAQYSIITLTYNSNAGTYSTFTGGFQMETTYLDGVESYTNRYNYFAPLSGSNGMPVYKLWAFDINGNAQPFTITAGTGTTKVINTCTYRLSSGIFWNGYSGANVAANARLLPSYQYLSVSTSVLNYTHNGLASPLIHKPFYLKAFLGSDPDTFTLDNSSYTSFLTQTLPNSDDGRIYIYLGTLFDNANNFILESNHPVYYYKNGALRLYNASLIDVNRGVVDDLTDLDNLSNPGDSGIWTLNTDYTYYKMPSPYCGTIAQRTIDYSDAELIVNVLPSASVTQKIHFSKDNKYHIRTFNKTEWTPWERVITCKDAVGDEVPAVLDGKYTINISEISSNSTVYNYDKEEILLVLIDIEDYVNNQHDLGNSGVFTFKHTLRFDPATTMSPTIGFTYNGNLNLAPVPYYLDTSLITTAIALVEFTFKVFYGNNQINTSVSNIVY